MAEAVKPAWLPNAVWEMLPQKPGEFGTGFISYLPLPRALAREWASDGGSPFPDFTPPTIFSPTPSNGSSPVIVINNPPVTPGTPAIPVTPGSPVTPGTPVTPVTPVTPGQPTGKTYMLSLMTVTGGGMLPKLSGRYDEGTQISVKAVPEAGWTVDHWEINGQSFDLKNGYYRYNPFVFTITQDTLLKVYFMRSGSNYVPSLNLTLPGNTSLDVIGNYFSQRFLISLQSPIVVPPTCTPLYTRTTGVLYGYQTQHGWKGVSQIVFVDPALVPHTVAEWDPKDVGTHQSGWVPPYEPSE